MKLKLSTASALYKSQTLKENTPLKQRKAAIEYGSGAQPKTMTMLNKQV